MAILFQDTRVANIDAGDARITLRTIIYNIHLCKEYILRQMIFLMLNYFSKRHGNLYEILTSTFENMSPVVFDV